MRTVSGTITAAEITKSLVPRHQVTVRNELLAFGATTFTSNASLDTGVPPAFAMLSNGTQAYAGHRYTTGGCLVQVITLATAANWGLSAGVALDASDRTMRPGVFAEAGGNRYAYVALPSGAAIQVKRYQLTGTSNPLTPGAAANYGTTFGPQLVEGATLVRRVEAVCPTDHGVIVAVGSHNFTAGFSTLQFWWIPSSGATPIELTTIIQATLSETYTAWNAQALWACRICAVDLTDGIQVFVNANPTGRAMTFSVRNGIESELRPVMPSDVEDTAITFTPASCTKINGLYYLTGHMTRRDVLAGVAQSTGLAFDCYLISANGRDWSVGERSFYAAAADCGGTLLLQSVSHTVYYGGAGLSGGTTPGGYVASAPATLLQDASATGTSVDLSSPSRIRSWGVQQVSNGADALQNVEILNGDGLFESHAILKKGATLLLRTGQGATLADFGQYTITKIAGGKTAKGIANLTLSGQDLASRALLRWKASLDLQLPQRAALGQGTAELALLSGMVQKTPERDAGAVITQLARDAVNGITFGGLNDPAVLYFNRDAPESGDGLVMATVAFAVSNDYHLSSLGMLIGAAEDGTSNILLVPKGNSWSGHTQTKARLRTLALPAVDPAEPDAANTGWNLTPRVNALWEGVGADVRTAAAAGGSYRTDTAPAMVAGTTYDLVWRVCGKRVQLAMKTHDLTPANCANNAAYTIVSEFSFDEAVRKLPAGIHRSGLVMNTDVFVNTDAFSGAVADDVEAQLTYAANTQSYTKLIGTGQQSTPAVAGRIVNYDFAGAGVHVGQIVRVAGAGVDANYTVTGLGGPSPNYMQTSGTFAVAGATGINVYGAADAVTWGYGDSGYKSYSVTGGSVQVNTLAKKRLLVLGGKCIFIADNTAALVRRVLTDRVRHMLYSGSHGGTGTEEGWDTTSPTSNANAWRMVLHPNLIFQGRPSDYGLPEASAAAQYFLVDDEVIRYELVEMAQSGHANAAVTRWTCVPTYYAPARGQAAGLSSVRQYSTGTDQPGDNLGTIADAAGLLFEITSKSGGETSDEETEAYHVTSVTDDHAGSGSYVTLDKALPVEVRGPATYTADSGDLLIVSGRAQFDTAKVRHAADVPVCYFPCDTSGNPPTINVSRLDYFAGTYQSIEDAIRRIAALAGLRKVYFRDAFSTPGDITRAITTTPYTLPLRANAANFVLDMNVHVPGNSTGSGAAENRLVITFRGYYGLVVQVYNTAAQIAAGHQGNVRVGLYTTSTDISAPSSGDVRWLQLAPPLGISDYNLSGAYSGSNPNYTLTEDPTRNVDLRVVALNNLISVEMNGQQIWTFNLDALDDGAGNNYRRDTAGAITVAYTSSVASNSATIATQELWGASGDVVVRRKQTGRQAIDQLFGRTHTPGDTSVRDVSTADGGRTFSQWWVRDDAGTLQKNLLKDAWERTDGARTALQQMAGQARGEAIDTTVLADDGFSFDAEEDDAWTAVEQCVDEAMLLLREQQEFAEARGVEGYGRIALQPEDIVALVYSGHTSTDHVITAVTLRANRKAVHGSYDLRKYVVVS